VADQARARNRRPARLRPRLDRLEELSLSQILAPEQPEPLSPPLAQAASLPLSELAPPVFERLIAEVATRVDGNGPLRLYGRSGQSQHGLDIWGGPVHHRSVYQVRRIQKLTASGLATAVRDYANHYDTPPAPTPPAPELPRFEARRFVLAVGCAVDDTKVDDELARLQREYAGRLDIELWDRGRIAGMLHEHGALVASIFGLDWARAWCGHYPNPGPPTPPGPALLNDPIDILDLSDLRQRAVELTPDAPAAAAQLYEELANTLDERGFVGAAEQERLHQRDALLAAATRDEAFALTARIVADRYDRGERLGTEAHRLVGLPESVGPVAVAVAKVLKALDGWAENGHDLPAVARALATITAAGDPIAGRLGLALVEQVITDEDLGAEGATLLGITTTLHDLARGLLKVRLGCAHADLNVALGTDPPTAFERLVRDAREGRVPPEHRALILRRAARALAGAGRAHDTISLFRESVLQASDAHLGGDAGDALRSIAALTEAMPGMWEAIDAAKTVAEGKILLGDRDRVAFHTLDSLATNALPEAFRAARMWVRDTRITGALLDEREARERYGRVYERAGEYALALPQLVLGGTRELAQDAAERSIKYVDLTVFLGVDQPVWVRRAATAATTGQADLVPDAELANLADLLLTLLDEDAVAVEALRALAALGTRLPPGVVQALVTRLLPFLDRGPGQHRNGDSELLGCLRVCVRSDDPELARQAVGGLVQALRLDLPDAASSFAVDPETYSLTADVRELAESGSEAATHVLVQWDHPSPVIVREARRGARSILAHQLGTAPDGGQPPNPGQAMPPHPALLLSAIVATGNRTRLGAACLSAALADDNNPPAGTDEPDLEQLRDQVVDHLLRWAEDVHDSAASRRNALDGLLALRDVLSDLQREAVSQRLLAIADHPGTHPVDDAERASQHPLSRWRVDLDGDHFLAHCLNVAARTTTSVQQATQIAEHLTYALPAASDDDDTHLLAQAIHALHHLQPQPLTTLARHPAWPIRLAAVRCWAEQDQPDSSMPDLSTDAERHVRAGVAAALLRFQQRGHEYHPELIDQLRNDPSATVRRAARP
jgi:hypothetical protein